MDSQSWQRIDRIFAAALELPPDSRSPFLDEACADDLELRREVESLLAQDCEDDFLEQPAAAEAARLLAEARRESGPGLAAGQVLGRRFRILGALGSGGMGEVWRALDLKLRVDVALKAVRPDVLVSPRAVEALRQEVRAAREVVSPNVCRVFDLVEVEGHELLSMEYVDGTTLAEVLAERAPLPLDQASDIASQLLAGLEAIHAAGLIHRDIKPQNVMLTAAGRVVVMDFGIAKAASADHTFAVAGTPAYMAPEQRRGEAIDARADVYSAGMVLAAVVKPAGAGDQAATLSVRAGAPGASPRRADTPWAPVLQRAVAIQPEDRYPSAAALARALEEATRRTTGKEDARPYPGLASFTAGDAEFFFGRELEIEQMWRKLQRPHLQALVGPSGAGKSSFLRAGLVATAPRDWSVVVTAPGDRPFAALARALAPELAADVDAVARLVDFEQVDVAVELVASWRRRHRQALLVVDQFEELFTQNPPEAQQRFAELLGRLAIDADVHVLLSMRDDFLLHCHRWTALAPLFSELTPLGRPTGAALRRALVQPALRCGYRFEDDALVDEILVEVAGERGALPLLAFAMARLWEHRDRERGLLTRAAYEKIGGVAGALAQHAEETLARIGGDCVPIVRDVFRNVVTSDGTRIRIDREDLLAVFAPDPATTDAGAARRLRAAVVVDELIAARLLNAFDEPSLGGDRHHHWVEVIHESLLQSWPRLVRWQAQDEESALLRDQLRQAARLWESRGTPADLLWTGTSFREYQLWRERYPGGLSATEERFARAMMSRNARLQRRRRTTVAALLIAASTAAATMGVLWLRSERARAQAVAAAQHAEAEQLLTLGQLELEKNPTATVAYALASLERQDSPHARRLVLRALWRGPIAFELAREDASRIARALVFSPDGSLLLAVDSDPVTRSAQARLWGDDGSPPREVPGAIEQSLGAEIAFSGDSRVLVISEQSAIRMHSLPGLEPAGRIEGTFRWSAVRGQSLIARTTSGVAADGSPRRVIRWLRLPSGELDHEVVWTPSSVGQFRIDPAGTHLLQVAGPELDEWRLDGLEGGHRRVLRDERTIFDFLVSPDGSRIHTLDEEGRGRTWSRATGELLPGPRMEVPINPGALMIAVSTDGGSLARANGNDERIYLWDLEGPVAAEPLLLRRDGRKLAVAFHPSGGWLAAREDRALTLWPLARRYPRVLRGPGLALLGLAIDPHGEWIAAGVGPPRNQIWIWPLRPENGPGPVVLGLGGGYLPSGIGGIVASPRGDRLAVTTMNGVWLVPLDGAAPEKLPGFDGMIRAVDIDAAGRRIAAAGGIRGPQVEPGEAVVRVVDLDTGAVQVLDAGDAKGIGFVQFLPEGRLIASSYGGVLLWDLASSSSRTLLEGVSVVSASQDGRYLFGVADLPRPGGLIGEAFVYDVAEERRWNLTTHGAEVVYVAWDPAGRRVVTGSRDGTLRVGPLTGEEPHLVYGHESAIWDVEVDPEARWFASSSEDGTVRIWPMPEAPPLHTLPREELLARLRSLTNYRVRDDPASPSGFRIEAEPFAGWKASPPTW